MSYAKNPSDNAQTFLVFAPDAVAAAADVDASSRIDMSLFEYVEVMAAMGDGDTAVVITPQEVAVAAAGTPAAIAGKAITLGATDDNTLEQVEIRTHGRLQYLTFNVTGTGGTASDVCIIVKGYGRQYTADYPAHSTSVAEIGLA